MLYNKDRLDTAYSNVALIADGAWSVSNAYVRANQELLLYECRFKIRMGLQRTVLDTIPESRLAQYGLYFYDEIRESCYTIDHPTKFESTDVFSKEEAWMTEEVDRIFHVMNDPNSKIKDIEKSCAVVIRELEENEKARCGSRGVSDKSFRELGLQRKIRENACPLNVHLRQLWEPASGGGSGGAHVPCSVLNVDVPEFYPKVHQPPQDLYLPENAVNEPGVGAGTLSSAWRTSCLYEPWLTYGYPVRAHEFRGLDSLVDGLRLLPSPPSHAPLPAPARRLYSAVLQNSPPSSTGAPAAVDEDELERQAMEQYRRSEETIAQQYQELERLAEEQYNGGCCGEACTSGNGPSPRRREPPCTAGPAHTGALYQPALAAHVFVNMLLTIAKLRFMRLGARFCHLR